MLANFRHVDAVLRSVSALIVFGLALGGHATAQPADLYDFTGGPADGRAGSVTSLATGPDGNLYGTSQCGGNAVTDPCTGGYGAIFTLRQPAARGDTWTFEILHGFSSNIDQGNDPITDPLAIGSDGTLYGTAFDGNLVWSLSPPSFAGGAWTYQVVHYFEVAVDGLGPTTGVTMDAAGTLYGQTTSGPHPGKAGGGGSVYALMPPAPGTTIWSETVLHTFPASYVSLDLGVAPVVSHNREYVYGMIESAVTGAFEVFQLHLVGTVWKYSVIYTVPSGLTSFSNLVIDSKRNLYFYALSEQYGYGPLLRLSPPPAGEKEWSVSTLTEFTANYAPTGDLLMDAEGALQGTAVNRTDAPDTIFILAPPTSESVPWTFTVIGSFPWGSFPMGVHRGPKKSLIGVTEFGGLNGYGMFFQQ
jgi:hypothetical protein